MENFEQFEGNLDERCAKLSEMIREGRVTFFGGAGVSTASGIPDFRSSDGMYNAENKYPYNPEKMLSKSFFHHNPKLFFEFYRDKFDLRKFEPCECHKQLALMEEKGLMTGIITQNVDGLHEKAGSKNIANIHGTIYDNYCLKCGKHFDVNYIFDNTDVLPKCDCGREYNIVRPKVTLYEENLDGNEWDKAMEYLNAHTLIVAGTSLTVNPAASMVSSFYGTNLIIINRDTTPYDQWANIIFREDIDDVFKRLEF